LRQKARLLAAGLAATGVIALSACSSDESSDPTPTSDPGGAFTVEPREPTELELPIRVAVTLPIFEDFVRIAGKENVEVFSLVPPGSDPHLYEETPGDINRVNEAQFFFYNRLGLDTALAEALEDEIGDEPYVVPFAPNVRSPRGDELGNSEITAEEAGDNPHLWLDPMLAYVYAEIVADEFVIYDGVRETFYNDNFAAFRDEMVGLRDEITAEIEKIPAANRRLVTYHDSFAHFARRFGLEVAGFAVPEPGAPADPAAVDSLVGAVQAQSIPAVFAEHGYDRAAIDAIASRAGVPVCTLYSDILPEGVDTYVEMMRRNVAEIVRCLGG
jgi:ABC-type Zn uptake system ZnuABC Zn-binding protein ZnuA